MSVSEVARIYAIGDMTESVKVRFRRDIALNIFNISVDAKADDTQMVPKWLARVFKDNGLADIQEQDLGIDLLKALSRERITGPEQISPLRADFYIRLNSFVESKKGPDRDKLLVSMQDIVLLRLGKIINFARSAPLTPDLEQKLTFEEKTLFRLVHKAANDFKECVLGGRQ